MKTPKCPKNCDHKANPKCVLSCYDDTPPVEREPDVRVSGGGSIYMVEPVSETALTWVEENVGLESWQWMGDAFAVEHRYIENLVAGMQDAGLTVNV